MTGRCPAAPPRGPRSRRAFRGWRRLDQVGRSQAIVSDRVGGARGAGGERGSREQFRWAAVLRRQVLDERTIVGFAVSGVIPAKRTRGSEIEEEPRACCACRSQRRGLLSCSALPEHSTAGAWRSFLDERAGPLQPRQALTGTSSPPQAPAALQQRSLCLPGDTAGDRARVDRPWPLPLAPKPRQPQTPRYGRPRGITARRGAVAAVHAHRGRLLRRRVEGQARRHRW